MPRYDFTKRALENLRDIARYTKDTWGQRQARLSSSSVSGSSHCRPAWVASER